ncbi:50S ribosomal protein L27 [Neisseria wadsworthii 9715]|uniref:50S ribosomal protein L27 n=1 Tax=Neisseria wadsworthii 9715 TaxID=1030841 RepID=G4CP56_9NEIS|nr:50S ribosomal protein L27 [Neisseria wadsworthii 9715]
MPFGINRVHYIKQCLSEKPSSGREKGARSADSAIFVAGKLIVLQQGVK